jgi:tetratricopeptide (TPR) repeat protein
MPAFKPLGTGVSLWLALAVALLWTVHPLQTESVTYVVQRAESLVALFYLLTLYCVICGATAAKPAFPPAADQAATLPRPVSRVPRAGLWYAAAVLACLLGMAAKEVMATAPLVVLLYDRTFLAGSLAEALRRRWGLYLGMAATWALLAYLVLSTGLVGRTATIETSDSWAYACTQPGVILHYLRLCFWPSPLHIRYHWPYATTAMEILPGAVVLAVLAAATLWGLIHRTAWGFLGACFFLILAPTSSLIVLKQPAFEHRMYLPLAAVVTLVVLGGYAALTALGERGKIVGGGLVAAVCLGLAILSYQRNGVFQSEISIWADTVAKDPTDAEAYNNLGVALAKLGKRDEAIACYRKALEIEPDYAYAQRNLGENLYQQGKLDEALLHCRKAVESDPDYRDAHFSLGNVLFLQGHYAEAVLCYRKALAIDPAYADAHGNLGFALEKQGKPAEAIAQYEKALELNPSQADAHENLSRVLYERGKVAEALAHWREVLRVRPERRLVLDAAAWVLATSPDASLRNGAEAVALAQRAMQLSGGRDLVVCNILAAAYAEAGQFPQAVAAAGQALDLAVAAGNTAAADVLRARIKLYQAGRPLRSSGPTHWPPVY